MEYMHLVQISKKYPKRKKRPMTQPRLSWGIMGKVLTWTLRRSWEAKTVRSVWS